MKVFQHAIIVTVNSDFDVIHNGTLAVEGKKIAYVGPHREFPESETVDCSGKVIMPGFINGHSHMPMIFFRGYTDDLNLQDWLSKKIFPLESRHTPDTEYHGALAAAAELTRTGTTTVNDMYLHGEYVARALKEAGLSGIVSSCLMSGNEDVGEVLKNALETAERYRDDEDIRTAIAPHAEYTCTPEDLRYWGEVAKKTGQPIHI
ncbi:MAG: amidohydrolase family protein, partial [Oscillospiraceae bacterium]|nr:amidohydrolase family protein [Oscillospiraceae bacterium]